MGLFKDTWNSVFRDFTLSGVPSSGRHEPLKQDIRGLGDLIEQLVVSGGVASQVYDSTAAGIAATSNGNLFLVKGSGEVFATLWKNSSGSAVDQGVSLPSSAFVQAADGKANTALDPERPIIETGGQGVGVFDPDGRYGGGAALYLPISAQYFRSSSMAEAGILTPTNADVGGRMANFAKIAISGPADTTMRVIFNYANLRYELLAAESIPPDRYITIGFFVVGQNRIKGLNGFQWIAPDANHIFPLGFAVVENGQLLIPQFYTLLNGEAGFSGFFPENGAFYFERGIQPDTSIARRYIADKTLKDISGGTYEAAVHFVDGLAAPLDDGYKQITLATCTGGYVSSEYFQIVGDQGRPPAVDQSPFGLDADALTVRDGNATVVPFTDPALLALGVTRGFTNPATTGTDRSVYFGTPLRPKMGQQGMVRFFAQIADGTGNFDNPRLFLRIGNSAVVSSGNVKMIRRISAASAEFVGWIGDATGTADNLIIGFDKNGVDSYRVIVSPFSYHFSDQAAQWIGRPAAISTDLAYGDQMFLTAGRERKLFPRLITKMRKEFPDFLATISSNKAETIGYSAYEQTGKDSITIQPDKCGDVADIDVRQPGAMNNRFRRRVAVYKGPAAVASGSIARVLIAGDSLVDGMPIRVAQSLARLGYSVTTVGTLINEGGGTATSRTNPGEGHPGKTVAQMVGKAAGMDPVAAGGESAYLAMSDDDKNSRNPFLKAFESGDPSAYKVTLGGADYVWSMAHYISRFGFAAPTHFIYSGGRNDIFFDAANAVANVEFGFDVRYSQTRAAYPTAPIFFTYFGEPASVENQRDWPAEYALIQAYRRKVASARAAGDTNVYFISTFAHTPGESWDDPTVLSTSSESGTIKGRISDTTHMGPGPKQGAADCLADAVNATSGAAAVDVDARTVCLNGRVLVDRNGRLGGGAAIYVSLTPIAINDPRKALNAGFTPTNAASTELPGYAKFPLSSATPTNVHSVYFDITLRSYVLTVYPAVPAGSAAGFVPIVSIWGAGQSSGAGIVVQDYEDFRLADLRYRDVSATDYEIVHDRGGLWGGGAAVYGPLRFFNARGFASSDYSVANAECAERAGYWKLTLGDAASVETLVFDTSTREYQLIPYASVASALPAKYSSAIIIARFFREMIHSDFNVRRAVDGVVENQNPYGRAMVDMPWLYQSTVIADITDPALTALGFSKGIARIGNAPYAGMAFEQPVRCGRAFFRCFAQTSASGAWSTPVVYFWDENGSVAGPFSMLLERSLSDTARIYSLSVDAPTARFTRYLVGCTKPSGADMTLTGFQHHLSNARARDILRDDFPAHPYSPVVGSQLFMASDRALPVYTANLFLERTGGAPTVSIASDKAAPASAFATQAAGGVIMLDPDTMGASAQLLVRPVGDPTIGRNRTMSVKVADVDALSGLSSSILAIGDSITNRQTLWMVDAYLAAWGVTTNWIGTLQSSATLLATGATGPLGEGREGWAAYGDYLGYNLSDGDVPGGVVAAGGEAAYLALGKTARMQMQPFLNSDTGAGSSAPIVTVGGVPMRFDLAFYRSRFSLALPEIVMVNLGMNDFFESPTNFRASLIAILAEARRAFSDAHILCWQTVMPVSPAGNLATAGQYGAIRSALVETIEALRVTDTKVHLCSAWAHQTAEGWPVDTGVANAQGVSAATVSEYIHPGGAARTQHALSLACAIANLILAS